MSGGQQEGGASWRWIQTRLKPVDPVLLGHVKEDSALDIAIPKGAGNLCLVGVGRSIVGPLRDFGGRAFGEFRTSQSVRRFTTGEPVRFERPLLTGLIDPGRSPSCRHFPPGGSIGPPFPLPVPKDPADVLEGGFPLGDRFFPGLANRLRGMDFDQFLELPEADRFEPKLRSQKPY